MSDNLEANNTRAEISGWFLIAIGGVFVTWGANAIREGRIVVGLSNLAFGLAVGGFGIWWKSHGQRLDGELAASANAIAQDFRWWLGALGVVAVCINLPNLTQWPIKTVTKWEVRTVYMPSPLKQPKLQAGQSVKFNDNIAPGADLAGITAKAGRDIEINRNDTRAGNGWPGSSGAYKNLSVDELQSELSRMSEELSAYSKSEKDEDKLVQHYKVHFAEKARELATEAMRRHWMALTNNAPSNFREGEQIVLTALPYGPYPIQHAAYYLKALAKILPKMTEGASTPVPSTSTSSAKSPAPR